MTSADDPVLFELRPDGVGVITLNRPGAMNAWTNRMGTMYFETLRQCAKDPAVKVIVVTGAGHFSYLNDVGQFDRTHGHAKLNRDAIYQGGRNTFLHGKHRFRQVRK